MKVFFDNCTPPRMARTLNGYIESDGDQAFHISDLMDRNASDSTWMEYLRADSSDWMIITGDDRIRRNKAEARAFRQAGLKGFVLASAYQKTPQHRCCAVLVQQWPLMLDTWKSFDPPILFELSINFSGRLRSLSL
jgi:hypothetical protein